MKQKKFISMLAAGALCLSLLPTSAFAAESMDNFKAERDYPAGQFTDVVAGSWYAGSVETAYELGLVEGTSKTTFSPTDPITISSTLALACRLYSTYYGDNADLHRRQPSGTSPMWTTPLPRASSPPASTATTTPTPPAGSLPPSWPRPCPPAP